MKKNQEQSRAALLPLRRPGVPSQRQPPCSNTLVMHSPCSRMRQPTDVGRHLILVLFDILALGPPRPRMLRHVSVEGTWYLVSLDMLLLVAFVRASKCLPAAVSSPSCWLCRREVLRVAIGPPVLSPLLPLHHYLWLSAHIPQGEGRGNGNASRWWEEKGSR